MNTILLVEDGELEVLLMRRAIEGANFSWSLQVMKDGDGAIEYLSGAGQYADRNAFPLPALVLLDLVIPGHNGHEVLEWIRNQPDLKSLPVIMLTHSFNTTDAKTAHSLGVSSYLIKPTNVDHMRELLTRIAKDWLEPKAR
jgi:CheY-like chemotaxis protein